MIVNLYQNHRNKELIFFKKIKMNTGDIIELVDGRTGTFIEYNVWDGMLFQAEINGKKEYLCMYELNNYVEN